MRKLFTVTLWDAEEEKITQMRQKPHKHRQL